MRAAIRYKDMIVSLMTGTGLFNISDFVPALARLDLQGVQAKLRRVHHQFDGLITKMLAEHAATAADRARQGRQDFVDRLRDAMDAGADDESGETITEVNIKGLIFVSTLLSSVLFPYFTCLLIISIVVVVT
jgi:flavonoid 3',5'-hydroxylase